MMFGINNLVKLNYMITITKDRVQITFGHKDKDNLAIFVIQRNKYPEIINISLLVYHSFKDNNYNTIGENDIELHKNAILRCFHA